MSLTGETVLLISAFNSTTGYGMDGITLAQELLKIGVDLHLDPLTVGIPLPEELAYLFTKPRPDRFDTAIVHTDPKQLSVQPGLAKVAAKVIGWTMWEFTSMKSEPWAEYLEQQFQYFDAIIAYDEVSKQALSEYFPEERIPVLQGGYDSDFWKSKDSDIIRNWDGVFRFGMVGALNQRKNPFATINAFDLLKEQYGDEFHAELHMKNIVPTLHPAMEIHRPWLKIYYASWPRQQLKQFYKSLNCLVAPSWGEGKNLPALEAQTTGIPVIVSKFGGHLQWADPDWTYLVDGKLAEHSPGQFSMRVDENELASTMWHVYTNKGETYEKGLLASKMIPIQCDWSNVVEKLRLVIDEVTPKLRNF